MTEELAQRHVVNPATAERLELDAPDDQLAAALYEARNLGHGLRAFQRVLGEELNSRLDRNALWTLRVGDYEVRGESPKPKDEWDVEQLVLALDKLVNERKITPEARDAALQQTVTWKPRANGLKALLKLGGDVARLVESCRTEVEPQRRVPSVRRA